MPQIFQRLGHTHAHEQVPWGTQTSQGAMLIMLHMPTHQPSCDKECVDTMGFTAKFDLAPCDHCVSGCHMSVPWDKMGPEFEDKGKGFKGTKGKGKSPLPKGSNKGKRDQKPGKGKGGKSGGKKGT